MSHDLTTTHSLFVIRAYPTPMPTRRYYSPKMNISMSLCTSILPLATRITGYRSCVYHTPPAHTSSSESMQHRNHTHLPPIIHRCPPIMRRNEPSADNPAEPPYTYLEHEDSLPDSQSRKFAHNHSRAYNHAEVYDESGRTAGARHRICRRGFRRRCG